MIKSKFIKDNDIVLAIPELFNKIKTGIGIEISNYSLFFPNIHIKKYIINSRKILFNCHKENFLPDENFKKYFYHTNFIQNDKIKLYIHSPLANSGIFKKVIAELNDFEILFEKDTLIFNFVIDNDILNNI